MSVRVSPPHTLETLVEFVMQAEIQTTPYAETVAELVTRFGLSEEDAALAWDRTLGGVVRGRYRHC